MPISTGKMQGIYTWIGLELIFASKCAVKLFCSLRMFGVLHFVCACCVARGVADAANLVRALLASHKRAHHYSKWAAATLNSTTARQGLSEFQQLTHSPTIWPLLSLLCESARCSAAVCFARYEFLNFNTDNAAAPRGESSSLVRCTHILPYPTLPIHHEKDFGRIWAKISKDDGRLEFAMET